MSTKEKEFKRTPIQRAFLRIFQSINKKLQFTSHLGGELDYNRLNVLIQASVSKCVEFNIAANRTDKRTGPAFVLLGSLRGICEDLIYITFISNLEKKKRNELIGLLLNQNIASGLVTQQKFFEVNNPTQPVLTFGEAAPNAQQHVVEARNKLRDFWSSIGVERRNGPTIRDMANEVGLASTYEYIYFAASNFVHFNPQALLRMGWGPNQGPFTFSISNMDPYYRSFSGFYGAVLFIGFHAAFGEDHFSSSVDTEIAQLLDLISQTHRWPEVITFEEMNKNPPLYPLAHAIGRVLRQEDPTIQYGSILREVQNLRHTKATQ